MKLRFVTIVSVLIGTVCSGLALSGNVTGGASARELVSQMQATLSMYQDDAPIREALIAAGEEALPAIEEGLRGACRRLGAEQRQLSSWGDVAQGVRRSPDMLLADSLLRSAAAIRTDRADELVVSTIGEAADPWVKWRAVFWLETRVIRASLTAGEKNTILRFIEECGGTNAGTAAMVLANCVDVAASERVPPILARFIVQVGRPAQAHESWGGAYVSPYVRRLNAFLRAFSYAGEAAVPYLREAVQDSREAQVSKWLTIARGMAGDAEAAADIERIIRGEPDTSTRVEATRAYARSAKEAAIPLLVELLDDRAELVERFTLPGGRVVHGPQDGHRPVAGVAADELSRLGHHDLVLSHRQSAGSQGTQTAPGG